MGVIRPRKGAELDNGDRWALSLADHLDDKVIGTRASILALSEQLHTHGAAHAVYRRPGREYPWQLVQGVIGG